MVKLSKSQVQDLLQKAPHPAIIKKEVSDKVQGNLGENKKTFTSPSQNKYNLLLRGLVRCGYCDSVMSSHYSIKNGYKYFYYKCTTRVMHRDKEACPSKPLSAREFESAIVEKIKELSQDRSQLEETLKNANLVAQKELEPLRDKKILLEKAKRGKEEEIRRLIKAIKVGNLEIEAIEEELKHLEEEKKSLERQIEELNIYIRREESKLIDIDIVQRTYQGFNQVFPNLPPKERHQLLRLIIKELMIFEDRIKVSFYEIPELALSIQNTKGLCEPTNWLPLVNIFRTFYFNEIINIKDKLEVMKDSFAFT